MIRFLVHFSTGDVQIEIEAGSSELLPMTMCFLAWFGVHLQGHAQKQHFGTSMATNVVGNSIESPTWRHFVMETSCYGNILLWKHLVMETSCIPSFNPGIFGGGKARNF